MNNPQKILIHDAAFFLRVPTETLRRWDARGKLKAKRDKSNRYRYYTQVQLKKFKESLKKTAP